MNGGGMFVCWILIGYTASRSELITVEIVIVAQILRQNDRGFRRTHVLGSLPSRSGMDLWNNNKHVLIITRRNPFVFRTF
mmetsp:Transcript_37006/g.59412  ORF Transcript_37006/g.59412 Transcript_37006/m.59412 type:complete len:80 (+) Transcript_37006:461-700(+)